MCNIQTSPCPQSHPFHSLYSILCTTVVQRFHEVLSMLTQIHTHIRLHFERVYDFQLNSIRTGVPDRTHVGRTGFRSIRFVQWLVFISPSPPPKIKNMHKKRVLIILLSIYIYIYIYIIYTLETRRAVI
jgi:hypothetical protein